MKDYRTIVIMFIVFCIVIFAICRRYERSDFDREIKHKQEIEEISFNYELIISDLNDSIETLNFRIKNSDL